MGQVFVEPCRKVSGILHEYRQTIIARLQWITITDTLHSSSEGTEEDSFTLFFIHQKKLKSFDCSGDANNHALKEHFSLFGMQDRMQSLRKIKLGLHY